MGKLIEYKVNDDTYVFFGEYAAVNADVFDPAELDYVMRNGSQMESFGETWAGSALDANYVLGRAIASYVNDDLSVEIVEVCDQIRDYKAQMQSYSHEVEGRTVPDVVVTAIGEKADLIAISQTGAYYVNEESNIFIATRSDGSLATNYEAFFESALAEDFDNGQMIFMTDVLRENLQEMAGEDFVSQDELNNKDIEILSVERPQPEHQKELDYGVVHFREGNRSGYGMVPMELLEKKEGEIADKAFVAELIKNDEFELPDLSSLPYYSDVSHALLSLYDMERKREPGRNSYYFPEVICEYVCEELEADMVLYPALAASIEIVPDENSEGVNIHLTEDFRSCIADHYQSERIGRMAALDGGVPGKKIFEQVEHALDVVAERNIQLIPNGGEVERTLKEALKDFENLSGQEVLISLMREASFTGKRENCTVLYGTMKYETQKDRQDAFKWAKKWLNKSAKELDHELSKLQAKNKGR